MALCVERFRHSTALIVCLESGIFTQLATLAPHLTTQCRLADGNNVQTLFSCGFHRSKVNVCGLCIEVNCLYITIERELILREVLKENNLVLYCCYRSSVLCISVARPTEPPFILFPCKTIDVSCTPIWYEQLILVVQAKQQPLFLSTKAPINVLLKQ